MFTPWGLSQHVEQFARGLCSVSTAGHGGYMVGKGFAMKHLSPEAQAQGMEYGNYLAYEEDCLWAVVAYELPKYWPVMFPKCSDPVILKASIVRSLERWVPEYLNAVTENDLLIRGNTKC